MVVTLLLIHYIYQSYVKGRDIIQNMIGLISGFGQHVLRSTRIILECVSRLDKKKFHLFKLGHEFDIDATNPILRVFNLKQA